MNDTGRRITASCDMGESWRLAMGDDVHSMPLVSQATNLACGYAGDPLRHAARGGLAVRRGVTSARAAYPA